MSGLFTKNSHTMLLGQAVSGITRQPATLYVVSGLAWITIEGLPDDHWLRSGDMLSIPADRLIVIESGKDTSRIEIQPAPIASDQAVAQAARRMRTDSQSCTRLTASKSRGTGQSGACCQGST